MTEKHSHTPGPWTARQWCYGEGIEWGVGNSNECILGVFRVWNNLRPQDTETKANADLAAAAPDLLAACEAALTEIDLELEQRKTSGNDEYWKDLPNREGQDHWFWERFPSAPHASYFSFTLHHVAPIEADALVRVRLHGRTSTGVNPDHHTRILLNGIVKVAPDSPFP